MWKKIINYVICFIIVFFIILACISTNWGITNFAFLNIDELIFQLTTPIGSASNNILYNYLLKGLFPSIVLSIFIYIVLIYLIKKIKYKKVFTISILIIVIISLLFCLYKIGFFSYIYNDYTYSNYIKDNYVNPKNVQIEFPENKRNLIYIYVESLESTYFNNNLGGESKYNYIEPLKELTKENINFSDTDKFGGAIMVPGTTWTTGASLSQTTGIPMKVYLEKDYSKELVNPYSLGDILFENGYNLEYMIGSDKKFGERDLLFEINGNYKIYDLNTAISKHKIDKDYKVWWGFEDSKLFKYAKEEILELANQDKPFNFTLLTANTHHIDGYLEKDCKKKFNLKYNNAIYCSANQINEFVRWIQEQSFYDNTTIVIVGDHVSMQPNLYDINTKRRTYNLFINSYLDTTNNKNRIFNNMDMFPTTLASIGVNIQGNRLGLGTNLFSDEKTLMERDGTNSFINRIKLNSKFYEKEFIYK